MALTTMTANSILTIFKLGHLAKAVKDTNIQMSFSTNGMLVYTGNQSFELGIKKSEVKGYADDTIDAKASGVYTSHQKQLQQAVLAISGTMGTVGTDYTPTMSGPEDKLSTPEVLMQMIPVDLVTATIVCQPVNSTSQDSKYFVVAISEDLKVAARIKGSAVSIRVEGNIIKHKSTLLDVGFSLKNNGSGELSHASLHVDAGGKLRAKVIGSALLGMCLQFDDMITDTSILFDKGE